MCCGCVGDEGFCVVQYSGRRGRFRCDIGRGAGAALVGVAAAGAGGEGADTGRAKNWLGNGDYGKVASATS